MKRGEKVLITTPNYTGIEKYGFYDTDFGNGSHQIRCISTHDGGDIYYTFSEYEFEYYHIHRSEIKAILDRLDKLEQFKKDIEREIEYDNII